MSKEPTAAATVRQDAVTEKVPDGLMQEFRRLRIYPSGLTILN